MAGRFFRLDFSYGNRGTLDATRADQWSVSTDLVLGGTQSENAFPLAIRDLKLSQGSKAHDVLLDFSSQFAFDAAEWREFPARSFVAVTVSDEAATGNTAEFTVPTAAIVAQFNTLFRSESARLELFSSTGTAVLTATVHPSADLDASSADAGVTAAADLSPDAVPALATALVSAARTAPRLRGNRARAAVTPSATPTAAVRMLAPVGPRLTSESDGGADRLSPTTDALFSLRALPRPQLEAGSSDDSSSGAGGGSGEAGDSGESISIGNGAVAVPFAPRRLDSALDAASDTVGHLPQQTSSRGATSNGVDAPCTPAAPASLLPVLHAQSQPRHTSQWGEQPHERQRQQEQQQQQQQPLPRASAFRGNRAQPSSPAHNQRASLRPQQPQQQQEQQREQVPPPRPQSVAFYVDLDDPSLALPAPQPAPVSPVGPAPARLPASLSHLARKGGREPRVVSTHAEADAHTSAAAAVGAAAAAAAAARHRVNVTPRGNRSLSRDRRPRSPPTAAAAASASGIAASSPPRRPSVPAAVTVRHSPPRPLATDAAAAAAVVAAAGPLSVNDIAALALLLSDRSEGSWRARLDGLRSIDDRMAAFISHHAALPSVDGSSAAMGVVSMGAEGARALLARRLEPLAAALEHQLKDGRTQVARAAADAISAIAERVGASFCALAPVLLPPLASAAASSARVVADAAAAAVAAVATAAPHPYTLLTVLTFARAAKHSRPLTAATDFLLRALSAWPVEVFEASPATAAAEAAALSAAGLPAPPAWCSRHRSLRDGTLSVLATPLLSHPDPGVRARARACLYRAWRRWPAPVESLYCTLPPGVTDAFDAQWPEFSAAVPVHAPLRVRREHERLARAEAAAAAAAAVGAARARAAAAAATHALWSGSEAASLREAASLSTGDGGGLDSSAATVQADRGYDDGDDDKYTGADTAADEKSDSYDDYYDPNDKLYRAEPEPKPELEPEPRSEQVHEEKPGESVWPHPREARSPPRSPVRANIGNRQVYGPSLFPIHSPALSAVPTASAHRARTDAAHVTASPARFGSVSVDASAPAPKPARDAVSLKSVASAAQELRAAVSAAEAANAQTVEAMRRASLALPQGWPVQELELEPEPGQVERHDEEYWQYQKMLEHQQRQQQQQQQLLLRRPSTSAAPTHSRLPHLPVVAPAPAPDAAFAATNAPGDGYDPLSVSLAGTAAVPGAGALVPVSTPAPRPLAPSSVAVAAVPAGAVGIHHVDVSVSGEAFDHANARIADTAPAPQRQQQQQQGVQTGTGAPGVSVTSTVTQSPDGRVKTTSTTINIAPALLSATNAAAPALPASVAGQQTQGRMTVRSSGNAVPPQQQQTQTRGRPQTAGAKPPLSAFGSTVRPATAASQQQQPQLAQVRGASVARGASATRRHSSDAVGSSADSQRQQQPLQQSSSARLAAAQTAAAAAAQSQMAAVTLQLAERVGELEATRDAEASAAAAVEARLSRQHEAIARARARVRLHEGAVAAERALLGEQEAAIRTNVAALEAERERRDKKVEEQAARLSAGVPAQTQSGRLGSRSRSRAVTDGAAASSSDAVSASTPAVSAPYQRGSGLPLPTTVDAALLLHPLPNVPAPAAPVAEPVTASAEFPPVFAAAHVVPKKTYALAMQTLAETREQLARSRGDAARLQSEISALRVQRRGEQEAAASGGGEAAAARSLAAGAFSRRIETLLGVNAELSAKLASQRIEAEAILTRRLNAQRQEHDQKIAELVGSNQDAHSAAVLNARAKLEAAAVEKRGLLNRLSAAASRERSAQQALCEREAELAAARAGLAETRAALQGEQQRRDKAAAQIEGANEEVARLRAAEGELRLLRQIHGLLPSSAAEVAARIAHSSSTSDSSSGGNGAESGDPDWLVAVEDGACEPEPPGADQQPLPARFLALRARMAALLKAYASQRSAHAEVAAAAGAQEKEIERLRALLSASTAKALQLEAALLAERGSRYSDERAERVAQAAAPGVALAFGQRLHQVPDTDEQAPRWEQHRASSGSSGGLNAAGPESPRSPRPAPLSFIAQATGRVQQHAPPHAHSYLPRPRPAPTPAQAAAAARGRARTGTGDSMTGTAPGFGSSSARSVSVTRTSASAGGSVSRTRARPGTAGAGAGVAAGGPLSKEEKVALMVARLARPKTPASVGSRRRCSPTAAATPGRGRTGAETPRGEVEHYQQHSARPPLPPPAGRAFNLTHRPGAAATVDAATDSSNGTGVVVARENMGADEIDQLTTPRAPIVSGFMRRQAISAPRPGATTTAEAPDATLHLDASAGAGVGAGAKGLPQYPSTGPRAGAVAAAPAPPAPAATADGAVGMVTPFTWKPAPRPGAPATSGAAAALSPLPAPRLDDADNDDADSAPAATAAAPAAASADATTVAAAAAAAAKLRNGVSEAEFIEVLAAVADAEPEQQSHTLAYLLAEAGGALSGDDDGAAVCDALGSLIAEHYRVLNTQAELDRRRDALVARAAAAVSAGPDAEAAAEAAVAAEFDALDAERAAVDAEAAELAGERSEVWGALLSRALDVCPNAVKELAAAVVEP